MPPDKARCSDDKNFFHRLLLLCWRDPLRNPVIIKIRLTEEIRSMLQNPYSLRNRPG